MRLPISPLPCRAAQGCGPLRPSFFRSLSCSIGGVQEFEFCREVTSRVVGKLKQWQIAPLQDVDSEHFVETRRSGLQ